MPAIALKHIVSFSSEDSVHKAENLLKDNTDGKWRCGQAGEKQASVIIQLEKATAITSIDIGNDGSAFIEVLVSRSSGEENYKVLLVASSFMSLSESRSGSGANRVRMFSSDKLSQDVIKEKWDRVKIVCTQPFNKHSKYGLQFINFHTAEQQDGKDSPCLDEEMPTAPQSSASGTSRTSFGAFKLKTDVDDSIPSARPTTSKLLHKTPDKLVSQISSLKRKLPSDESVSEKKAKTKSVVPVAVTTSRTPKGKSPEKAKLSTDRQASKERGDTGKQRAKVSKDFSRILKDVVFVISGYQNPERANIRDKGLLMGARYKRDWDKECTHLICAFRNTPKYQQVLGTDGHVVRADWLSDCHDMRRKLPRKNYNMRPDDSSESSSDEDLPQDAAEAHPYDESTDEESPDTEEEVERIFKQTSQPISDPPLSNVNAVEDPYDVSTDDEAQNSHGESDELPTLPDYFSGRVFFLHGTFESDLERMIRRHIITCDGSIANYMSDDVRYVVTESSWQDEFDDVLADNTSVAFVRPGWIFKCGKAKKLLPYQPWLVPTA